MRRLTTLFTAVLLPACLFSLPAAAAQQHEGQYDIADIAYGAQLFSERCVVCHGPNGDLMPQANLRRGTFRNASTDRDLQGVIRDGVPGTAMAATGYAEAELAALVAYLRNITSFDGTGVTIGDAAAGKDLFEGEGGCTQCHRVGGSGPAYAPPLTSIGRTRTAAALRRVLQNPVSGMMPSNRPVHAVTADGRVVEGRRLNEDTFSVQLVSKDERLVSLDKRTLKEYRIGNESAMPAYGDRFSEQQIADLLGYLLSLKGAQP
ncbi:MAG: c-type cytochrome [Gammaproteobacteria bacterium]|nr:c-type cytochrome [Gammaproteobacteria bacterium]